MENHSNYEGLWPLVKMDLKRAFSNKWFTLSVGLMCVIAAISAACAVAELQGLKDVLFSNLESKYYGASIYSCLKAWIGLDVGHPATSLFYFLIPIAVALPYSWSLAQERKTGYSSMIITRVGRSSYFISKFLAIAASGAAIVGIPLVGNLIVGISTLPFVPPDVTEVIYWGMYENAMLSELFYQAPLLYVMLMISLSCLFGALWALFITCVSFVFPFRAAFTLIPFLVLFVVDYMQQTIFVQHIPFSITPFEYLRGTGVAYYGDLAVTCIEYAVLLGISVVSFFVMSRRDLL